jgi:dTDP-4-amino-4,6-dideoxygalactose transaminase
LGVPRTILPITEDASRHLLRLPIYFDLTDRDVAEVGDSASHCRPSPAIAINSLSRR